MHISVIPDDRTITDKEDNKEGTVNNTDTGKIDHASGTDVSGNNDSKPDVDELDKLGNDLKTSSAKLPNVNKKVIHS